MLAAPQYAVTKRLGRVYPPGAAAADGRGEDPLPPQQQQTFLGRGGST